MASKKSGFDVFVVRDQYDCIVACFAKEEQAKAYVDRARAEKQEYFSFRPMSIIDRMPEREYVVRRREVVERDYEVKASSYEEAREKLEEDFESAKLVSERFVKVDAWMPRDSSLTGQDSC